MAVVAAFTRPHRCGFHPLAVAIAGARPSVRRSSLRAATAFAGAACGVTVAFAGGGRAHSSRRYPVRRVG